MGRLRARCKLGFDLNTQVHHHRDEPGIVGAAIYRAVFNRPAIETQSPEQGGGCRRLPNFPDNPWFWRHQLMSAPLVLPLRQSLRLVLSDSMACFLVGLALAVRQPPPALSSRTCPGAAAHIPLHSPRGSAARRPASAPPLPPLSSSHSSHRARRAAAHTVVSLCPVRTAPRYSARFLPAAGASSCPRLC